MASANKINSRVRECRFFANEMTQQELVFNKPLEDVFTYEPIVE